MRGSFEIRERLLGPSVTEGNQQIHVSEESGKVRDCEAILRALDDGGLAMDCPEYFRPNTILRIEGKLSAGGYSMHLVSRARVVSCRRISPRMHRIGVELLDAQYRPVVS